MLLEATVDARRNPENWLSKTGLRKRGWPVELIEELFPKAAGHRMVLERSHGGRLVGATLFRTSAAVAAERSFNFETRREEIHRQPRKKPTAIIVEMLARESRPCAVAKIVDQTGLSWESIVRALSHLRRKGTVQMNEAAHRRCYALVDIAKPKPKAAATSASATCALEEKAA